ncbi:MAG: CapA family protein [Clostridia bacterium]|nr:CapA family protein [Clostridia bacterium]
MKKKLLIISSIIFLAIVSVIAISVFSNQGKLFSIKAEDSPSPSATEYISPSPTATEAPTPIPTETPEPIPEYTDIVIGFTGDIISHERVLDNAIRWDNGSKSYTFDHIFKYIKPALDYPDLMIANLESPIAGEAVGYSVTNTLTFNFPDEIATAIKNSGIDMVLNANNHACDKNPEGLFRTLDVLDEVGLMHTGAWRSPEERSVPTVVDIQGIKVGIVSATFSLNGREAYVDKEILSYMTCFIDTDQVKEQIDLCREYGAEIVIVSPHMGDEYAQYTREGFRDYARAYIAMGADLVVAHHPHVLQSSEIVEVELEDGTIKQGVVFFSIGNFMSNQVTLGYKDFAREARETGIILYVNIQKNNYTGEVKIESLEYLPIWMLRRADINPRIYAVLPAGKDIDFLSDTYTDLKFTEANLASLARAWDLAISQVGVEYADVLSDVPVRDE